MATTAPKPRRAHTLDELRAALAFVEAHTDTSMLKRGEDHPHELLTDAVDELIERRALWEEFKGTVTRWSQQFQRR